MRAFSNSFIQYTHITKKNQIVTTSTASFNAASHTNWVSLCVYGACLPLFVIEKEGKEESKCQTKLDNNENKNYKKKPNTNKHIKQMNSLPEH